MPLKTASGIAGTPESCISYYQKNGDYLAIVSNLQRKAADVILKVPSGICKVWNAEDGREVKIVNGEVVLSLPRNDYRALRMKGK